MKNMYVYDLDSEMGLKLFRLSLEYEDELDSHSLKITSDDKVDAFV